MASAVLAAVSKDTPIWIEVASLIGSKMGISEYMGVFINGGTQQWIVYEGKSHPKMDING